MVMGFDSFLHGLANGGLQFGGLAKMQSNRTLLDFQDQFGMGRRQGLDSAGNRLGASKGCRIDRFDT
ncbi:MAG: hypothetical protein MO852_05755 [Candidatus Devosia euplotis]|nr:hypothetical protein [Candidatus Devosia euplotis]